MSPFHATQFAVRFKKLLKLRANLSLFPESFVVPMLHTLCENAIYHG